MSNIIYSVNALYYSMHFNMTNESQTCFWYVYE